MREPPPIGSAHERLSASAALCSALSPVLLRSSAAGITDKS